MQPDGEPPLLELKRFSHTYLEGTPRASEGVKDVTFRIRRGERVGIVGATQSGKSTVVDSFAHLLRLKPGQVFYEGEDVAAPATTGPGCGARLASSSSSLTHRS